MIKKSYQYDHYRKVLFIKIDKYKKCYSDNEKLVIIKRD